MRKTSPVYTTENGCQDCYKCVRHCPVKAIRIADGKASVIPEACVSCGECVKVCPAHAKKIRSDYARLLDMLESGAKVYASIAPSFAGAFPHIKMHTTQNAIHKIVIKLETKIVKIFSHPSKKFFLIKNPIISIFYYFFIV